MKKYDQRRLIVTTFHESLRIHPALTPHPAIDRINRPKVNGEAPAPQSEASRFRISARRIGVCSRSSIPNYMTVRSGWSTTSGHRERFSLALDPNPGRYRVWFRFITDVFTHWIVGRAVSTSLHTDALPPLALEAGSHGHRKLSGPGSDPSLGSRFQYVPLPYTDAIVVAEVTASVGTVGESYDNALAEAVNGLYKTEPIFSRPAWETATTVEFATTGWVRRRNPARLHEALLLPYSRGRRGRPHSPRRSARCVLSHRTKPRTLQIVCTPSLEQGRLIH